MDWIISPDLYPIRRVDCHMFVPATTVAYSTMSAVTIMVVQFKKKQWWEKVYLRLGGEGHGCWCVRKHAHVRGI